MAAQTDRREILTRRQSDQNALAVVNFVLDDLCRAILDAFDFIDGHLYEFCMDNRMYTDYSYQADPEGDGPSTAIEIDKLYLQDGQNFMLHYDFGDDSEFRELVNSVEP